MSYEQELRKAADDNSSPLQKAAIWAIDEIVILRKISSKMNHTLKSKIFAEKILNLEKFKNNHHSVEKAGTET